MGVDYPDRNPADLLALYLRNPSLSPASYKVGAVGADGTPQPIVPVFEDGRNFSFYSSVLLKDQQERFVPFSYVHTGLLGPKGKRPVAPSYLRDASGTGGTVRLEWDDNEPGDGETVMIFRSAVPEVGCEEGNLFKEVPSSSGAAVEFPAFSGSYHYRACSAFTPSVSNSFSVVTLSTPGNVVNVIR